MAFFYVKSPGGGTPGSYGTKQTGAWPANYYASIAAAVTGGAGAGDYVLVSDSHSTSVADVLITETGLTSPLNIISVSDTACETPTKATSAQETATDDVLVTGSVYFDGVYLKAADDIAMCSANSDVVYRNATLEVTGSGDLFKSQGDGGIATLVDSELKGVAGSLLNGPQGGSRYEFFGCIFSGMTGDMINSQFVNGGGSVLIHGSDCSTFTGYLLSGVGSTRSNDDCIVFQMNGCKLNASLTGFVEEELSGTNHRVEIFNSAPTADEAEYQFYIQSCGGYVENQDDSGIHRDESGAFLSGTKVSARCITNSNASIGKPFWFELPARVADLSSASSDVIRVFLTSTTTLTDLDVWVDILYPDGTNKHEYHFLSSRAADILGSGTALTTDSGSAWKDGASDLTGYNEYYIDLDTSADAGADGAPVIRISVAKASTTIYFDTSVEVVA